MTPLYTSIYLSARLHNGSIFRGGLSTSSNPILSWNNRGVLYPIDPSSKLNSRNRSPYRVSLNDFVLQFSTSSHRLDLLRGLLSFRAALHEVGLNAGFQWIDGSFLECVESLRSRPPKDIDVVTFYIAPAGETQKTLEAKNPPLFDHDYVADNYRMDAYFLEVKSSTIGKLISETTYWYSLWSHQRDSLLWKGYLQIDLSPTDDNIALDNLNRITSQGGLP